MGDACDLDDDNDGYTDADEQANGTSVTLADEKPSDFDGDFISDLNDPDDDNDGYDDELETQLGTDPFNEGDMPVSTDLNIIVIKAALDARTNP